MDLVQAQFACQVHLPSTRKSSDYQWPRYWYAVSTPKGIVAYFKTSQDAYAWRQTWIAANITSS